MDDENYLDSTMEIDDHIHLEVEPFPLEVILQEKDESNLQMKRLFSRPITKNSRIYKDVRKYRKSHGQQYINSSYKLIPERNMKPIDCTKCKFRCSDKFSEEERLEIHNAYWDLGDVNKQRDFITKHVLRVNIRRPTTKYESRRKFTVRYTLTSPKVGRQDVCRPFFFMTMAVTEKFVRLSLNKGGCGIVENVKPEKPADVKKLVPAGKMKPIDCTKCRFLCSDKFGERERLEMYKAYWDIGDVKKQRNFVSKHVVRVEIRRLSTKSGPRRKFTVQYSLTSARKGKQTVCRRFFYATLAVSEKFVRYSIVKLENPSSKVVADKKAKNKKKHADKKPKSIEEHADKPAVFQFYTRQPETIVS